MVSHWYTNNRVFYLPESRDWESDPEREISNINFCYKQINFATTTQEYC